MDTQNTTLYAQWSANHYKVKFDANGGTGTMNDEDYAFGESKTLSENNYTRDGYIFKGCSLVKDSAVDLADKANYTCDTASDVTLYANWEKSDVPATDYKLNFNLNGGTGNTPGNQTLLEGALATKLANPTREGYTFKGWNTENNGNGSYWNFETTTMPAHNVTLYAQWQKDENPTPGPNPNIDPTNNTKTIGKTTTAQLPKTGGYEALFMGILALEIGFIVCKKALSKNKY